MAASFDPAAMILKITVRNQVSAAKLVTTDLLRRKRQSALDRSRRGFQQRHASDHGEVESNEKNNRSIGTNKGLIHIALACSGLNGSFDLYLEEQDDSSQPPIVCTEVKIPARFVDPIRTPDFVRQSIHSTTSEAGSFFQERDLVIGTIDDSKVISKGYKRILLPMLSADIEKSIVCCPRNREEVEQFMEQVCPGDSSGHVDAVLLDQNIDLQQSDIVYGTDLAIELRARNFTGLIIIRSANAFEKDLHFRTLREKPVDLWLDKEGSNQDVVEPIREAMAEKRQSRSDAEGEASRARGSSVENAPGYLASSRVAPEPER